MKRDIQLKLKQLRVIIVTWVIAGFLITVYDHLLLHTGNSLGSSEEYSFLVSLARNVGAGFIGALLGGSLMVFYINVKYHDKPYGYTVLLVSVSFLLIVMFITLLMGFVLVSLRVGNIFLHHQARAAFLAFLKDGSHTKAALVWAFIVAITQLLLQVNSRFGQDVFWSMMGGRYNTPKQEKRIFMFLDINSSTSIAERLGDEKYHAFLKDFFADITYPILDNKGSIYQYVGDEVVVAWTYKNGIENMQCIKCFFDMKEHIQLHKEKYQQRYGFVPTFKAGIHCGTVVGGEVGIMKKDITYSGDVLNTTSRILNKCDEFGEEIITSTDLLSQMQTVKNYITRPLGEIKLKGKAKAVGLSAWMLDKELSF
jgi:adenylate cyclase